MRLQHLDHPSSLGFGGRAGRADSLTTGWGLLTVLALSTMSGLGCLAHTANAEILSSVCFFFSGLSHSPHTQVHFTTTLTFFCFALQYPKSGFCYWE